MVRLTKIKLLRYKNNTHRSAFAGSTGILNGCYCCDDILSSDGQPHLTS